MFFQNELNSANDYGVCKVYSGMWKEKVHLMFFKPKAQKPFKNVIFSSQDKADTYLKTIVSGLEATKKMKDSWKVESANRWLAEVEATKIGDVFVNSWGYEQTNVDFYQVVKKTAKKLFLRKIGSRMTQTTSWASGYFVPVVDSFLSDEIITKCGSGSFRKWDGREQYASWYA